MGNHAAQNLLEVSIIILNCKGWKETLLEKAFTEKRCATIECLESLYQIAYPNYAVIVVNNGSEDERSNTCLLMECWT